MRSAITAFFRLLAKIFFRRIEVEGAERIPAVGAVVFAVNHPNGLVDPLFLLCFAPRPISFLAKAPLFTMPVIGWFVRTFDSIPVYRKVDNLPPERNRETFQRAREILARGGAIAIFPEGTTHSDSRLRELKTGAARIALGLSSEGTVIIPTGIYYTEKQTFRSSALVLFGHPIEVESVPVDANGEPPVVAVDALTQRIERGLAEVTLQADSKAALELIARAEDIFSAEGDDQELADELEIRKRFVEGYHYLREHDPALLKELESRITRFHAELGDAQLDPHELVIPPRIGGLGTVLLLVVLLPLALIGVLLHLPAYRIVAWLAHRFAKGESEMVATMKFLGALMLYPLTWMAIALVVQWQLGFAAALLSLVVVPLLGFIALRVLEEFDEVIGRARALTRRLIRRRAFHRLVAQRRRIREQLFDVAREMRRE